MEAWQVQTWTKNCGPWWFNFNIYPYGYPFPAGFPLEPNNQEHPHKKTHPNRLLLLDGALKGVNTRKRRRRSKTSRRTDPARQSQGQGSTNMRSLKGFRTGSRFAPRECLHLRALGLNTNHTSDYGPLLPAPKAPNTSGRIPPDLACPTK